jgi:hypothetical protein
MGRARHLPTLLALALALAAAACSKTIECTTEVTAGDGSYKATAQGEADRTAVSKSSLRDACQRMCVGTKAPVLDTCVARCAVDAGAGKIGARTTCKP